MMNSQQLENFLLLLMSLGATILASIITILILMTCEVVLIQVLKG